MDIAEISSLLVLTLATGFASGINLYATVCALGLAGALGYTEIPGQLEVLESPWVIGAAGFMYVLEFVADKVPFVQQAWNAVHTFIRVPAGALMSAGVLGDHGLALGVVGGLAGGTMALDSHATKMAARVETTPIPGTNQGLSVLEDISVVGILWLAVEYPWLAAGFLVVFLLFSAILLRLAWSALRAAILVLGMLVDKARDAWNSGREQPTPLV